ncbi:MAG: tRNA pseudouridine(13) synthase TruD, partial [Nanoarchaeota archaeon]|nr:tRNA pseudouridine(13) synthase TruD [Nanoarchaeota archaeon]
LTIYINAYQSYLWNTAVKEVSLVKPGKSGNQAYYLLKKTNITTIDALQQIADFLRIGLKHIGFAGNKDKKAVTEQCISLPADLQKRLEGFKSKNIQLEFLGRGESRISLGDLEGNQFEIIIRDASKEPKKLERFINYFGEQRFSENNITIGRYIIKGKLEKAAMINREPAVLAHLRHNPKDFVGALKKLPKKILTIYINAYQSYLWNTAVKEYLMTESENIDVEIIGFGTEFGNKRIKEIYSDLMSKEKITLRDFIIRRMPDLSSEGDKRKIFVEPKDLKIEKIDKKTYKLTFFLPKGCYATELIRQMFE